MVEAVDNSRFYGVINREMGFTTPNLDSVQPIYMSSPFRRDHVVVEDDENDDIQSVPGVPFVEKFDSDLKDEATQIIRESRSVDSADVLSVRSELEKYFPGLMTEVEEQEALCLSKKKFQLALAELKHHFKAKRKPFNNLILLGTLTVLFSLLKLNSWIHEMTHDDGFDPGLELRLRIIDYEV